MVTITTEHATRLARDNLLGIFNERDPSKRRKAMKATYAADIQFHEPDQVVMGFEAVNDIIEKLLEGKEGWHFRSMGKLWISHDLVTLGWGFGPEGQDAVVRGNDLMLVNGEGKIAKMYTMIFGVSDVEMV